MKNSINFFVLLLFSMFFFSSCDSDCADDGYKDWTYTKEQWAGGLQSVIPFGRIRLNNYTAIGGEFCPYRYNAGDECDGRQPENSDFCRGAEFQFKHPCDCEINFVIGRKIFDLQVPRVGPNSMYKVYVNNINSNRLSADVNNQKLIFGVDFESDGTEIKLNCYNNLACFGDPAFELNNMHIDIMLQLTAVNNNVTYNDVAVDVRADFENSGMCKDNLFAFLCGDQRELVLSNLREQIRSNLLKDDIKTFVSQTLNNYIRNTLSLGDRRIRRATIVGSSLVLNLECR
jgi:hypothetical protein